MYQCMDKQSMAQPYNGYPNTEKEQTTDTPPIKMNLDNFAKWKKSHIKGYILYDYIPYGSIYM